MTKVCRFFSPEIIKIVSPIFNPLTIKTPFLSWAAAISGETMIAENALAKTETVCVSPIVTFILKADVCGGIFDVGVFFVSGAVPDLADLSIDLLGKKTSFAENVILVATRVATLKNTNVRRHTILIYPTFVRCRLAGFTRFIDIKILLIEAEGV
jgi:hypothetical protein